MSVKLFKVKHIFVSRLEMRDAVELFYLPQWKTMSRCLSRKLNEATVNWNQ